jgi:hypothetical protein
VTLQQALAGGGKRGNLKPGLPIHLPTINIIILFLIKFFENFCQKICLFQKGRYICITIG